MQVTETLNEGLKRKLSVVIPASDLNERLDVRLDEIKGQANIKGFRPGKVPMTYLKKRLRPLGDVGSDERRDQRDRCQDPRRAR